MAHFDTNVVLNLFTLALVIVFAVPVLKSRRKDAVIAEQKEVIDSHEQRIAALERDLAGAQQRANETMVHAAALEAQKAAAEARYAEQAKYTAAAAVEAFDERFRQHELAVQQRHGLMIELLQEIAGRPNA